jgi:hypothetical protein
VPGLLPATWTPNVRSVHFSTGEGIKYSLQV